MSTLSDLRSTLDEHAERVSDGEAVARTAAVHHRVSVVRRRRRAVGVGALALVVATGLGAVGLQRASSTPPPVVFGVRAPETLTSLGYTYRSDGRAATFAGRGALKVASASSPRLYSWTTDRPTRVRMVLPNGEIWTSRRTNFTDYVEIPADQSGTLRISVPQGSVGLASYTLTDVPPEGYTKDGVTFRQSVAGNPLLGAVIGDPGQVDATTLFTAPQGQVAIRMSCSGLPKGDVVHVSFDGHVQTVGSCQDSQSFDPGTASGVTLPIGHAGRDVTLRVWASSGVRTSAPLPTGAAPDLRMRVGVYGPLWTRQLAGYRIDEFAEHDGHLWRVHDTASSPEGLRIAHDHVAGQSVAAMAWHTHGPTTVTFSATGMPTQGSRFADGRASMGDLWVPTGASVTAGIGRRASGSFGIAYYRRVP